MPITAKLTQGKNCVISTHATIGYREHGGEIVLGDNVTIHGDAFLRTCTGVIKVGPSSSVGHGAIIHALGGVTIGKNTLISPRVQIYAQNHGIRRDKSVMSQPQTGKGVIIGDDCWIGAGVIICDGVVIETGCVIAAGSVVPEGQYRRYMIYAGNPAVKIGERS